MRDVLRAEVLLFGAHLMVLWSMFHSSTQKQHWLFEDEEDIANLRKHANASFCEKQEEHCSALLGAEEELLLVQYYQKKLVELCNLFGPPSWNPLPRTALVRMHTC